MATIQQQPASREEPPPYSNHSSELKSLQLPSVPDHSPSLPRLEQPTAASASLPNLTTDPGQYTTSPHSNLQQGSGITLRPLNLPSPPSHVPGTGQSAHDADNAMHVDARAASASIEDPDDRMAAEALCGLGKTEPARTLNGYETPLNYYPIGIEHTQTGKDSQQPEPLLSLLTSSHPWLGGTINGSLSAYSSTKSYSPRFIQYGADLVENTMGTVGRRSGVEGSIRRYLDARRPSELERIDAEMLDRATAAKRQELENRMDIARPDHTPRTVDRRKVSGASSVDSLPLYDDNRSPAYEDQTTLSPDRAVAQRPNIPRSWSTQLMISTSGLGVALSESSLNSLKFCLTILSNANRHVRSLMEALKRVLQQYRTSPHQLEDGVPQRSDDQDATMTDAPPTADEASVIAQRIKQINEEIWTTLKTVVNTVSSYTGGALPENASAIVRWQLMSVPRRWQRAVSRSSQGQAEGGGDDAVSSANRMLAFAIEGLDMMEQVGGVVDSTIMSAERWLESLGRKKTEQSGSGEVTDLSDGDQKTAPPH